MVASRSSKTLTSLVFRMALVGGAAILTGCPAQPTEPAAAPAGPEVDYKAWYDNYVKDVLEGRDLNKAVSDYWSPNIVNHNLPEGENTGADKVKAAIEPYYAAFTNVKVTVDDLVTKGNVLVTRITFSGTHSGEVAGIGASGKEVQQSIMNWYRLNEGKITDVWSIADSADLLRQIGATTTVSQQDEKDTFIRAYVDAVNSRDAEKIAADFLNPSVTLHGGSGGDLQGVEAVKTYLGSIFMAFPDLKVSAEDVAVHGSTIAVRIRYAGTMAGAFAGRPATNAPASFESAIFYRIENGKISEIWSYWDPSTLGGGAAPAPTNP